MYVLFKNRRHLHPHKNMSHEEKMQQITVQREYGSIYVHYIDECYYYDIVDIFRRLLLTGGLIHSTLAQKRRKMAFRGASALSNSPETPRTLPRSPKTIK